ncbi:MAG: 50S ribosomal protein L30 [Candidatus Methanomethyliaceae archaeon]|nr:50S ribosomal protein L30 [Candidatus Methanomethyliaceae archaeon]
MKLFLAIRIRGITGVPPEMLDVLNRLNIPKKHSASLIPDNPSMVGMLKKVSDYITWGEISRDSLVALLKKRGRLEGNKRLTEESLKKIGFNSFEELADKILTNGKVPPLIKKTFRLTPPSGGFKGPITKHVNEGGELGYRGEAINQLLSRMI